MKFFNDSLGRIAETMLSGWGMMLVDPSDSGNAIFDETEPFLLASAVYASVFSGDVVVICQQPLAEALTRNLLGLDFDADVSDDDIRDALKELANVVSGNFVTEAFGEEAVFDLPSIEVKTCGKSEIARFLGTDTIYYLADDMPIAFRVEIAADEADNESV